MPTPSRSLCVLLPILAVVGLLVTGTAARAQAASAAPIATKQLLADFVEISSRQALRSDAALLELINMSDITLDVHVGEGATSLKPSERMLAGVQPGTVTVKVLGQDVPTGALEGDLEIIGGRHYELALAYAVPPEGAVNAVGNAPLDAADGSHAAAAAADVAPAPVKAAPATGTKAVKPGKVQIGRKRT